jgi:serine/threonine protein kinase
VIRHANRGGVYRATDQRYGAEVLVKQARPHVGALLDSTDARDRLREEARLLEVLAPLGLYPARVELFAEQGHLFLAEELIAGSTLDRWTGSVAQRVRVAGRLVTAVRAVHDAGLVIRDLKPGNVMVTTSGAVRMIDAEGVAEVGTVAYPVVTPAFTAPEVTPTPAPVEDSTKPEVNGRASSSGTVQVGQAG